MGHESLQEVDHANAKLKWRVEHRQSMPIYLTHLSLLWFAR